MLGEGWAGGLWGLLRFCRFLEIFVGGSAAQQPQRTEPCQCVSGQSWVFYGPLKGQVQPLQQAVGVVERALGAGAGLARWFLGLAVLPLSGDFCRWKSC